jgi:hypothetical protein
MLGALSVIVLIVPGTTVHAKRTPNGAVEEPGRDGPSFNLPDVHSGTDRESERTGNASAICSARAAQKVRSIIRSSAASSRCITAQAERTIVAAKNRILPPKQAKRDYAVGSELTEACYFAGYVARGVGVLVAIAGRNGHV